MSICKYYYYCNIGLFTKGVQMLGILLIPSVAWKKLQLKWCKNNIKAIHDDVDTLKRYSDKEKEY